MTKKKEIQCLGEILPVFKVVIDDCEECGVQSIELVSNPIDEFKFIKVTNE